MDVTSRLLLHIILCVASFTVTEGSGSGYDLHVTPSSSQIKPIFSSVVFGCHLVGSDAASLLEDIYWKAPDGQRVQTSSGDRCQPVCLGATSERVNVTVSRLYVRRIQEVDKGRYTCEATFTSGATIRHDVDLVIYEEIVFQQAATYFRVETGSDAFLDCAATGMPQPEISWRFERRKIEPDTAKYRYEKGGLRVFTVTPADSGVYECRAEVTSQGIFKVRPITLDVLYAPVITEVPDSSLVMPGGDITLTCRARGNPPVKIEWYRDQKVSDYIKVRTRVSEGSETYRIAAMTSDDTGKYYCKVSNTIGVREVIVDLTLMVPPRISELPHRQVREGGTVIVPCEATGVPTPTFTWKRVGNAKDYSDGIQQDDRRVSVDSTELERTKLVISNVTRAHAGLYTCTARTSAGVDQRNATVTVEYVPTASVLSDTVYAWRGQTRQLTCVAQAMPPPTISWLRGGAAGFFVAENDIYKISSSREGDTTTSVLTVTISEDSEQPTSVYEQYTCIAKNVYGSASKSTVLKLATEPEMPRNVSVISETTTSLVLRADAPRNTGGLAVTTWRIQYFPSVSEGEQKTAYFDSPTKMEVTDLLPGTVYNFMLSASNAVGYGAVSKFQIRTPPVEDDNTDDTHQHSVKPPTASEPRPQPSSSEAETDYDDQLPDKKTKDTAILAPGQVDEPMVRDREGGGGLGNSPQQQQDDDDVWRSSVDSASAGSSRSFFGAALPSLTMLAGAILVAAILVICVLGLVIWARRKSTAASRWSRHDNGTKYPRLLTGPTFEGNGNPYAGGQGHAAAPLLVAKSPSLSRSEFNSINGGSLQRNGDRQNLPHYHPPAPPQILLVSDKSPSATRRLHVQPQQLPPALQQQQHQHQHQQQGQYDEAPTPAAIASVANNPRSAQKQAWDRMLQRPVSTAVESLPPPPPPPPQHQGYQGQGNSSNRPISTSELPPPPQFLLSNGEELDDVQDVLDGYQSAADTTDGYHSNADTADDMEEVDIRLSPYYDKARYTVNV